MDKNGCKERLIDSQGVWNVQVGSDVVFLIFEEKRTKFTKISNEIKSDHKSIQFPGQFYKIFHGRRAFRKNFRFFKGFAKGFIKDRKLDNDSRNNR